MKHWSVWYFYNNMKYTVVLTFAGVGVNKQTPGKLLQPSCSGIHKRNTNFVSVFDWLEGIL